MFVGDIKNICKQIEEIIIYIHMLRKCHISIHSSMLITDKKGRQISGSNKIYTHADIRLG